MTRATAHWKRQNMLGRILSTSVLFAFVASIFYFFGDMREEPRARAAMIGAFDTQVEPDTQEPT